MVDGCQAGVREIRTLLARAYVEDPLMRWVFPADSTRLDAVAAWLGLFVENHLETGRMDVIRAEAVHAVAVWRMPASPPSVSTLPSIGGLLTALVGAQHASVVGRALAALRPLAPQGPHAYLQFMAVDPDLHRQGLGTEVLGPGLERAADSGLVVHRETASPEAVAFYQRIGFETNACVELAGDGPPLWAMRLEPGARRRPPV